MPAMVAAMTALPVVGVPVKGSVLDVVNSLLLSLQLPTIHPLQKLPPSNFFPTDQRPQCPSLLRPTHDLPNLHSTQPRANRVPQYLPRNHRRERAQPPSALLVASNRSSQAKHRSKAPYQSRRRAMSQLPPSSVLGKRVVESISEVAERSVGPAGAGVGRARAFGASSWNLRLRRRVSRGSLRW